jgi:hypothetical protein
MTRLSMAWLAAVAALGLAAGCATSGAVAMAPDEPVAAWGAGAGPAHPEIAPGTRLEPENQPPPGGWPSLWAPCGCLAQPYAARVVRAHVPTFPHTHI